ncbi:MAG: MATE family efflux transporter [Anaerolineaceae bacterium]|nr:MATE family efflux transporter [Anaerolineaceae bacterium]
MPTSHLPDRAFLSSLVKVALPIIIQMVITNGLSLVDITLIGQLGDTAVAGVGLANQAYFLLTLLLFGITSASVIFTAQYWGLRDIKNIRKVLGLCVTMSLAAGILFAIIAVIFPERLLSIYSNDPAVIAVGSRYLQIAGLGYIPLSITSSYSSILRSVGAVKIPMLVSGSALCLNTFMGYILIFGKFGLPTLGVAGGATAICIARVLEVLVLLAITYLAKTPAAAKLSEMLAFDFSFVKRYLKTCFPVIINEMAWSIGFSTYTLVYAHIGTDSVAAANICSNIENLATVIFFGLANGCAVLVGHKIGSNEEHSAFQYARNSIMIAVVGGLFMGVIILFGADSLLSIYKISAETLRNAHYILMVLSATIWVKAFNGVMFIGVLRSGGDTRYAFLLETFSMWLIGVPMAFIGAFVFHLPVYWVALMVIADEVFKFSVTLPRFFSRKWIHNLAHQPA